MSDEIMSLNQDAVKDFTNPGLNKATASLIKVADSIKKNLFSAASILADVDDNKLYEDDGFANTADYAMKVFNIKKSVAYNMIKVGKEYTDKKALTSSLPHEGKDFTLTQVAEMTKLGKDTATKMIEEGKITPDNTCAEIREIVKSVKPSKTRNASEKRYSFSVKDGGDVREIISTIEGLKQILGQEAVETFERSTLAGKKKYYFEYTDRIFVATRGEEVVETEKKDSGDASQ